MGLKSISSDERPDIVLDLKRLTVNCNGNMDIVRELLAHLHQKSGPNWIAGLQAAVASSDTERMREICHGMKGASATVFAWRISNLALQLENLAHDGEVHKLGERIKDLEAAFDELLHWTQSQPELG